MCYHYKVSLVCQIEKSAVWGKTDKEKEIMKTSKIEAFLFFFVGLIFPICSQWIRQTVL